MRRAGAFSCYRGSSPGQDFGQLTNAQGIRRAGLFESERREKWVYYRTARAFLPLLAMLRKHFDLYPGTLGLLARDQKRKQKRVAERERSCAPSISTSSWTRMSIP